METVHKIHCLNILTRSYPTYEEWKHELYETHLTNEDCSYPTYEEWKLSFPQ